MNKKVFQKEMYIVKSKLLLANKADIQSGYSKTDIYRVSAEYKHILFQSGS